MTRLRPYCALAQHLRINCRAWLSWKIGVWGRLRPLDTPLRARDRIEVYRPLTVDPKEARRQRYKDRGQRIISRHRPLGGKTGP